MDDQPPLDEKAFSKNGARQRSVSETSRDSAHLPAGTPLSASTLELFISAEITVGGDCNDREENDADNYELHALNGKDETHLTNTSSLHHRNNIQHSDNKVPDLDARNRTSPLRRKSYCSRFCAMFDFRLFQKPQFLIIVTSCSLAVLPAGLYGMYLPAMAVDKGVTGQRSALLLTIFGACGIVSRLGFGYLADLVRTCYLRFLPPHSLCNFVTTTTATTTSRSSRRISSSSWL